MNQMDTNKKELDDILGMVKTFSDREVAEYILSLERDKEYLKKQIKAALHEINKVVGNDKSFITDPP